MSKQIPVAILKKLSALADRWENAEDRFDPKTPPPHEELRRVIGEFTGVHTSHCCALHGCKYGDDDCPVATFVLLQDQVCQQCSEEEDEGISWEYRVSEWGIGAVTPISFWTFDDLRVAVQYFMQRTLETPPSRRERLSLDARKVSSWDGFATGDQVGTT